MNERLGKKRKNIWPYLLLAPALIIMMAVVFVPICNAIIMSFKNYNLTRPNKMGFIGLDNYRKVFSDKLFWSSLRRTVIWVVFGVGFQFVFGFILALLLNKKFPGRAGEEGGLHRQAGLRGGGGGGDVQVQRRGAANGGPGRAVA